MYDLIYVDDDDDDQEFLKLAFYELGLLHRIFFVSSGEQLLKRLKQIIDTDYFPRLLLIDCNLGSMSGEVLYGHLQSEKKTRSLHVVFLSTGISTTEKDRLIRAGAKSVIMKPSDLKTYALLASHLISISEEIKSGVEPNYELLTA
jgi:CheY-like chemotaxis protein